MQLTEQQEIINSIIVKCWEDKEFQARLIADPISTIETFTGKNVNLPEGKSIKVVDQSSDSDIIYLNIPAQPNLEEVELSDEQLELIAGGNIDPLIFNPIFINR